MPSGSCGPGNTKPNLTISLISSAWNSLALAHGRNSRRILTIRSGSKTRSNTPQKVRPRQIVAVPAFQVTRRKDVYGGAMVSNGIGVKLNGRVAGTFKVGKGVGTNGVAVGVGGILL